ncbi:MAG TPA: sugar transferase [Syntrophales bacterium]|nr:sugar transferase [Syntrophales bacterium]HPX12050.1 sugar transferase [Syntrophales bacterium]HQB31517.1 sugar transferase [Syntrophales bacterium]HQN77061.1 sugar transferase [Syntrophales bacterium]HQQ26170.1 sugar transferase [Syntrophales bacterium]
MEDRIRNFLIALVLAFLLFPVTASIGAIIRLSRGRPVLYSEKRVGLDGRAFTLHKFRTLDPAPARRDPRDDLAGRVLKNGTPGGCRGPFFRALRKYSLDELPQIWNILRGEMAVVGPRPMPEEELLYRFGADSRKVTSVRPGLTGLWQINGRSDLSPEKRRTMDLFYVEHRSRRLDLEIIFKTFSAVLSGRGAY